MRKLTTALSMVGAAILSGIAAGTAYADPAHTTTGANDFSNTPWTAPSPHTQLQWDSTGRWGLRLNMNQPTTREADWKDMQAGAFFRITPSIQVRGSVGLGDRLASGQAQQITPQDATPRVHLETAFRF